MTADVYVKVNGNHPGEMQILRENTKHLATHPTC